MRRRDFITLFGGAVASLPLPAGAQQPGKVPTLGFFGPASTEAWAPWTKAFVDRLAELGWIDGRSINLVFRWANGHSDRFGDIAAELVKLKVDLIVTSGSTTLQTKKQTGEIPIIFALASEPVATGMVASLARPGGNVTGLSLEAPDLAGKRLGLLHEAVPKLRRLAVLTDATYPASVLEMEEIKTVAAGLGFEFLPLEIRHPEDIEPAFAGLNGRADAVYVCSADPLMNNNRDHINALALAAKLPTLYGERPYVESGGLMSYGPKIPNMFKRAAELADKILKGAKPADIPVEQPTSFELDLNLKTAKALGLTIPETFVLRADTVIE
jgi:putative ABC transport system substrate-binding protein